MLYVGDVGTEFRFDTDADLTNATVLSLKVMKPGLSEAPVTWAADSMARAADGKLSVLKYIGLDGDLNVAGWYVVVSYVEWGGSKFHGEPARFEVHEVWMP